jgi:hypothetical protein
MAALDASFRAYLLGILDLSDRELDKLVDELLYHWAETRDDYVLRRHRELQREGVPNREIYGVLRREITQRRFAPRSMTERQVRRLIYG